AGPAELRGDAEVQADRLGVADVQVAVGFGREAGADGVVLAAGQVVADDLADEVLFHRRRIGGRGQGRGRGTGRRVGHAAASSRGGDRPVYPLRGVVGAAAARGGRMLAGQDEEPAMRTVYEAANIIDAHLVRHALEGIGIRVFLAGEALAGA